jgi:phosphate starvation-inducible PhoH-like protein
MELVIEVASQEEALFLFGAGDSNLKLVRDGLGVQISARSGVVRIVGEESSVNHAAGILHRIISMFRTGQMLPDLYVEQQLAQIRIEEETLKRVGEGTASGRASGSRSGSDPLSAEEKATIKGLARGVGQAEYIESILRNELVFCIGPAGTGKTFLAVRMAVNGLRSGEFRKLILCRPAVEAGEKLGFLPGDFQAKINPYLRPLYDALNDILGYDQVKRYTEREIIEIIPLAYMRGRTLNNAFIILDEGQNTTVSQMKMFLTRLGMGSRVIVNGDVTQVDLPQGQLSGLLDAQRVVHDIRGVGWVKMKKGDIVRHPLVKRIVEAYESEEDAS